MKNPRTAKVIWLVITLVSFCEGAQWIQTSGREGGYVPALATIGTNLFAGTYGGVCLSTNMSFHQQRYKLDSNRLANYIVFFLAVIGANLIAGTNNGVYLSTKNGTSWTAVSSGLTNGAIRGSESRTYRPRSASNIKSSVLKLEWLRPEELRVMAHRTNS